MNQRPWLSAYPQGVPADINATQYQSLVELLDSAFAKHASKLAYSFMGKSVSYAETDRLSNALAVYFQSLGLTQGDRIAIMMPNTPQYPITVAAILRAGFVVVNANPLYTPRELEHQLNDSDTKAIVIMENFASVLEQCLAKTSIKHILLTAMGDQLGLIKGTLVNFVVRYKKKLVPAFHLPSAVRFNTAIAKGTSRILQRPAIKPHDVAVLQYTGGTTGVSKGATLLHRNLVANILQAEAWYQPALKRIPASEQIVTVCALPIYHIFGFTSNIMLSIHMGGANILIPNPRDLAATLKELARHKFHSFPAVNTMFNGLANHRDFDRVDWSHLKICVGGGMAVQSAVAKLWSEKTGCSIIEGYGLTETSPSASCNPADSTTYSGNIGLPLPNTLFKILDDNGEEMPVGQRGEIAIKGPQVMHGYWNRPEETANVMTADGFFKTGDIGVMDQQGRFTIVDRKKEMVLVSGFNVYPSEIEEVVSQLEGVLECAVISVPDEKSGEAVKLVIVKKDASLTEEQVRKFCQKHMTAYKRPKVVEFRSEMPKSPVGKILRRELRAVSSDSDLV